MIDMNSKPLDNSKFKFKGNNTKLPTKKSTNENFLKISDQKLKPILDRDNMKQINYATPLRKNTKNYARVSVDQNEPAFRISIHSSNMSQKKKNDKKNNLSCANDNIADNSGDLLNESLLNSKPGEFSSKKYIKFMQLRDAYTQKSPQKFHRRFNSSFAGTQFRSNNNTYNQNNIKKERKRGEGPANIKGQSYFNTSNHNNNSMLGDEHVYSRDFSCNKENNDLNNTTAILNQHLHLSSSKIDDNDEGIIIVDGVGSAVGVGAGTNDMNELMIDNNASNNLIKYNNEDGTNSVYNEHYEKGKQYYKEKNYEEALKCFKESVSNVDHKPPDIMYLLGVCYLWNGEYDNSIKEFNNLLEKQIIHYKNVYLLLSIAYKKSNNHQMAIKILSKAVLKYPKYYDAYIYRGKLYIKEKKWEKALYDFKAAIQINPDKGLGYIGEGDCLRMMNEHEEALALYTSVLTKEKHLIPVALLKRSIAYIELKRYDEALQDLENLLASDNTHSEAYYFKGLALQKSKNINDAILCFEQAIKHNNSKKAVIKSLYEIAKIKIENRDFYEAYHTLRRAEFMKLDPKILYKFKLFTEGVIFMMKRKHNEGIDCLTTVLKKQTVSDFLKPLVYNYRAYGYYCIGKIKKALLDYSELQKITTKLERSSQYNKYLCEGLLHAEQENYDNAFMYFEKASKIFKNKMEPYFYKACLQIYVYKKSNPKHEPKKFHQTLSNALKEMEKCAEMNDNCSNLLYYVSMVQYCLGKLKDALKTIEKAIEKAEENYAKYYHLRGLIQSAMKIYQSAISDFTIAINLDKNFHNAYLERGKSYFSYGDVKLAFLDIQKYISLMPNDPNIHLWAGNLLFNTGAFEDAAKAYSNSETIQKSEKLLLLRAKCYIALKELNSALADLTKLVEITNNAQQPIFDRDCLLSLKIATTTKTDGELDVINLSQALHKFNKLMNLKSCGYVFKFYDYHFYKAIIQFYLQEYKDALTSLDTAWDYKEKAKNEEAININKKGKSDDEGENMIKILEEFWSNNEGNNMIMENSGYVSFTSPEYLFNRVLILFMMKKYENAYETLMNLSELAPPDSKAKIELLLQLIKCEIDPKNTESDLELINPEKCYVFATENRLCSIFPPIVLNFQKHQIETSFSFCLPTVEPPAMNPGISPDIINEITVLSVENRPEAPWIRRNQGGVIFTENYLDREEKEIENLNEVIQANNLKEEDIYASLEKPSELKTGAKNSKEELFHEGIALENNFNFSNKREELDELVMLQKPQITGSKDPKQVQSR